MIQQELIRVILETNSFSALNPLLLKALIIAAGVALITFVGGRSSTCC